MLSIPKYLEQYAQHFRTIFYLLCCASQHHVTENHGNRPTLNIMEITENHGNHGNGNESSYCLLLSLQGNHGKITEKEMKVPIVR